jgi:hypothetical protein
LADERSRVDERPEWNGEYFCVELKFILSGLLDSSSYKVVFKVVGL